MAYAAVLASLLTCGCCGRLNNDHMKRLRRLVNVRVFDRACLYQGTLPILAIHMVLVKRMIILIVFRYYKLPYVLLEGEISSLWRRP